MSTSAPPTRVVDSAVVDTLARLQQLATTLGATDDRRRAPPRLSSRAQATKPSAVFGKAKSAAEAKAMFAKADNNGGGKVLFGEFCAYVAATVSPMPMPLA